MCLDKDELILPEEPVMLEKLTHTRKCENEELLKQHLKSLTVVMSLCDLIMCLVMRILLATSAQGIQ